MMRVLYLLLLFVPFGLAAQNTEPDERLSERFNPTEIKTMNEQEIAYWNFYLDHAFELMAIAPEKSEALNKSLEEIEINLKGFHAFQTDLSKYHEQGAYLKIKGAEKMLVVKTESRIQREFSNAQKIQK